MLEYLTLYKLDGSPIYSHCFGGFCTNLAISDGLLQGFISALSTVPEQLNQAEESSYTAVMGTFKLIFNKFPLKDYFICLGINKNIRKQDEKHLSVLFSLIDEYWTENDTKYDLQSKKDYQDFDHDFYHQVLINWSVKTGIDWIDSKHVHPPGYNCPLVLGESVTKNRSLWDLFKRNFELKSKSISKVKTKFGSLKIGSLAPDFSAGTEQGINIKLSNYKGNYVILYFYPKAYTPGCVKEAEGFRDVYEDLKKINVEVIGVSVDSNEKLLSFKKDFNIPYQLITDYTKEVTDLYSGVGLLGKANRITYLINPEGIITRIWKLTGLFAQLSLYKHAEEVKKVLINDIGVEPRIRA